MPITVARLEEIRADELADDLEIDIERMGLWSESDAVAFFQSGGETVPGDAAAAVSTPDTASEVRASPPLPKNPDFERYVEEYKEVLSLLPPLSDAEFMRMVCDTKAANMAHLKVIGVEKMKDRWRPVMPDAIPTNLIRTYLIPSHPIPSEPISFHPNQSQSIPSQSIPSFPIPPTPPHPAPPHSIP